MEIIGWIVITCLAVASTAVPCAVLKLSALGGGPKKYEFAAIAIGLVLATVLWYFSVKYAPFTLTMKG